MEPNKLENQFREKLNNRKINPSEAAWDRLDAMLSVADSSESEQAKQKPKRKYVWLYVAASIAGFLLVGTIFFNQKVSTIDVKNSNVVIKSATQKDTSKTEIKVLEKEFNYSKPILKQETNPLVQTKKDSKSNVENQTTKPQDDVLAEIQPINRNLPIAEIGNKTSENIDSLLASVEKKSKSESKKASIKINSTDLLNQVDGELQVSFREKALNTITQKYKEAKEALANRNNQ